MLCLFSLKESEDSSHGLSVNSYKRRGGGAGSRTSLKQSFDTMSEASQMTEQSQISTTRSVPIQPSSNAFVWTTRDSRQIYSGDAQRSEAASRSLVWEDEEQLNSSGFSTVSQWMISTFESSNKSFFNRVYVNVVASNRIATAGRGRARWHSRGRSCLCLKINRIKADRAPLEVNQNTCLKC